MSDRRFRIVGALAVSALALVVGAACLRNGFLNYDDPQMIVENPRLQDPGASDLVKAFTEVREFAWLPLYTIALMPEAAFFGGAPEGYHAGSVLWHMLGSVLVLAFVHALARNRAVAFVAGAIFAIHPIAAESVAWASGRKDQVSFVLLMLALSAALGHLRNGGIGRIVLSLLCAALALLAKGSAIVHPLLVLLLVSFVRADGTLSKKARPGLLAGSAFVLAAGAAAVHLWIAREQGMTAAGFTSAWTRARVFLDALFGYFSHLVYPVGLSIHYDGPPDRTARQIAGLSLLLLCAGAAVALRRRPSAPARVALLGAAWFLVALLPFNGVFPQTSVAMADRYAFVALPAFGLVAGALIAALGLWPRIAVTIALVLALVPLARSRYAEFKDGETVFRSAMALHPSDSLAAAKLGEALRDKRPATENRAEAIRLFRLAAANAADPVREARARLLLADALLKSSKFGDAVSESDRLLELERPHGAVLRSLGYDPNAVRFNRAAALLGDGKRSEALLQLEEILAADPRQMQARLLRAGLEAQGALVALPKEKDDVAKDRLRETVNRSIVTYQNVLDELAAEKPGAGQADQEIQAASDLSRLLQRADWRPDRLNDALMRVEATIRRHPGRPEGYLVRAQIMADVDPASALSDLRAAMGEDPSPGVLRAIASGFLALGKNREGIAALERARAVDPADPGPANDLRAIYVAAARSHLEGQTSETGPDVKRAREAVRLAAALGADHPEVLEVEAECFDLEGRRKESEALWRKIVAIDPKHPKARLGLARAQQQNGLAILANMKALTESYPADKREAWRQELMAKVEADFKAAVELAPDSQEVDLARGWLRNENRRKSVNPLLERARAAADKGSFDEAIRLLGEAAKLDPKYADVAELSGHLAMQKGDEAAAFEAFQRTLELDSENLAANDALARLYYKRGDRDRALERARRFLGIAAKMRDETSTLREEIDLMQQLVLSLEKEAAETRKSETRR